MEAPKQMFSSKIANEQPSNVSGKGRSSTPQTSKKTIVKGVVTKQAAEAISSSSVSKSLSSSSITKTTTGKSVRTITTVDQDGNAHTTIETVDDIPQSTTETSVEESNIANSSTGYVEYTDISSYDVTAESSGALNSPRYNSSNILTSSQNAYNDEIDSSSSVTQSVSTESKYNVVSSQSSSESKQILDTRDTTERENTSKLVKGKLIKSVNDTTRDNSNHSSQLHNLSEKDNFRVDELQNTSSDQRRIANTSTELNQSSSTVTKTNDFETKLSNTQDHGHNINSKENSDGQVKNSGLTVKMVGGKLIRQFNTPSSTKKSFDSVSNTRQNVDFINNQFQYNDNNVKSSFESNIIDRNASTSHSDDFDSEMFITQKYIPIFSRSNQEVDKITLSGNENSTLNFDESKNIEYKRQQQNTVYNTINTENVENKGSSIRMVGGKLLKSFNESNTNEHDVSSSNNDLTSGNLSSDFSNSISFVSNEQNSFSSSLEETNKLNSKASKSDYRITNQSDQFIKNRDTKNDSYKNKITTNDIDEAGLSVRMVGGKLIKSFKEPTPTKKNQTNISKSSDIISGDISSSDITTSTSFTTNEQTSFSSSFGETDQSNSKTSNSSNITYTTSGQSKDLKQLDDNKNKTNTQTTFDNVDEEGLTVRMVGGKLIKSFKEPTPTKKNQINISKLSDITSGDISSSDITTSTSFSTNEQTSISSSLGEMDKSNSETFNTNNSIYRIRDLTDEQINKFKTQKTIDNVDEEGLSVRMVGGKLIKSFKEPTQTKKNQIDFSQLSSNIKDISSSDIKTSSSFTTNEQISSSSSTLFGDKDESNLKSSNNSNTVYRTTNRSDESKKQKSTWSKKH
uniref:Uncharacterized protein n=1 Tax=Sipha flava TaxID=143950 RepID=A0A2S2QH02_9HEMI